MEKKDSDNMEHRKKEQNAIEDQKQDILKAIITPLGFFTLAQIHTDTRSKNKLLGLIFKCLSAHYL